MKEIYLDYASTTPLDPRVREAMEPFLDEEFGNPSGLYKKAHRAKEAVEQARATVAEMLGCRSTEIVFTAGGTEAVNLAIFGSVWRLRKGHIITTKIEHHAVLRSCEHLEKEGFAVTYIDVDENGLVDPEKVADALRPDTILVSVMYANNEIGTIEPLADIARLLKKHDASPSFFTDACQASGALELNVDILGVDVMALNGSKVYGPKGVGCLYVRHGIKLHPLIFGGGQEGGVRSGTENVAGIVGFAAALEIAQKEKDAENVRLSELRDYFFKAVQERIPDAVPNGHLSKRLPNNINISIPNLEGDAAVIYLDTKGIAASTGSACSATELEPSHVIRALGRAKDVALGSLRFTLGKQTIKEDLDYALDALVEVVGQLRKR